MFGRLGSEKKLVLFSSLFLFLTFAFMGLFMEHSVAVTKYGHNVKSFSDAVPVQVRQTGQSSSDPTKLKAMVKGSIYENGSNMTVFGACFDGDGYLLPEADARFTAWYPNGSIRVGPNATMEKIYYDSDGYHPNGTGRWAIHVTMGSTVGTYLTEIRCSYDGEWALAFGEWQNPEWVVRIADTQHLVENVSRDLDLFRNATNSNFSSVLSVINNINLQNIDDQVRELGDMIRAKDLNMWTLDAENPFYVLGSGTHNWDAVDMISPDAVAVASSDGYVGLWDGETWYEAQVPGVEFRGVSVLPANTIYAWAVGGSGGSPVYSINGGNTSSFALSGGGSPSAMNDIKLFRAPNDPNAEFYGYVVGDDGSVYYSTDSGVTWSRIGSVGSGSKGRISQVVENYDQFSQVNGYMVMIGQGNDVLLHDGSSVVTFNVSGTIADVDLLYYNLGYVVTDDTSTINIYKYNGSLSLEYQVKDATIQPTGVEANSQDDVWVTTSDPSTFYHFDGRRWEYSTVGFSKYVSTIITFGNVSNTTSVGVKDVSMSDAAHGYAVGGDGLILVYKANYDERFDQIRDEISGLLSNVSLNVNVSSLALQDTLLSVNQTITADIGELKSIVLGMNQSINSEINDVQSFLASMNASMEYKLDNIVSNVTYTNLYLQSTLYPVVLATYTNTLTILEKLGIIEGKLNQTIALQNQTLDIVNETSGDVGWVVNKLNKTRVRAWIIQ